MTDTQSESAPRGVVILTAFDKNREIILEDIVPVDDYYEELHPIIDENEFRSQRNIRYVRGRVFDYDGRLGQEFNNEYDANGAYVRSRILHEDGTIIED